MPSEKEVYEAHADQYERLIQREDYQGNILSAIESYCPLDGLDVVELGAGTGRLTRLLAPYVKSIKAFDASAHMLETAAESLREMGVTNWNYRSCRSSPNPGRGCQRRPGHFRLELFVTWQSGVARIGNPRYKMA